MRHPGSQRNRLSKHALADVRAYSRLGKYVYLPAEEILEVLLHRDKVEETATWFQINQDVYVALWSGLAAGSRAEYPNTLGTVSPHNGQDSSTLFSEQLLDFHRATPIRGPQASRYVMCWRSGTPLV
jgi:hypothetical protein